MPYDSLPDEAVVDRAAAGLAERGFEPHVLGSGAEALAWIKEHVPAGASVFNGTSRTLEQVGYVDYLKSGEHPWKNLQADIVAEADPAKKQRLRKEAAMADYYLGSVHAISEQGQLVIASASGSQMPAIVFESDNLVLVASTKKIAPSLDEALRRLKEVVVPKEDARMKGTGAPGTVLSKVLIYESNPGWGRTIRVLLVNEDLGF